MRGSEAFGSRAAVCVAAAVLAVGIQACAASGAPDQAVARPNIVVIETDDQAMQDWSRDVMPHVFDHVVDPGTSFGSSFVTDSECCPSRATFLTGQYPHNDGVVSNDDGYAALRNKSGTLPVWLGRAGYRTGMVGKYVHHYAAFAGGDEVPAPGWDRWVNAGGQPHRTYGYELGIDGRLRKFGRERRDHLDRVLARFAVRFVRDAASRSHPFFLWFTPKSPHVQNHPDPYGDCDHLPIPDPRDEHAFDHARLPRPPSFNEPDVTDKPAFIRHSPRLGRSDIRHMEQQHRCRLESLVGVDRAMNRLRKTLKSEHAWGNTVVVVTSDNGYLLGHHRVRQGKILSYEESIRVPLAMRVPPRYLDAAKPPSNVSAPVANIDLSPTLLDFAHADSCKHGGRCRTMDGRSARPLLEADSGWPQDRGLLIEAPCGFDAIRTPGYDYVEYRGEPETGGPFDECSELGEPEYELYDLDADPFELDNLYSGEPPPALLPTITDLGGRLEDLRSCAGVEGRDPAPPGGDWCE